MLEDDATMRGVIEQVLEEEGYAVDACSGSEQAIDLARSHSYELLITDIKMDGLDGLAALSEIQTYQPDLGSLVITGYADAAESERATRLGHNALLRKPFELDVLLDTVSEILLMRGRRLEQRQKVLDELQQARWATEWTACLLERDSSYPFSELSRLIRRLAQKMGLLGQRAEQLCLAGLWREGSRHGPFKKLRAPGAVEETIALVEESWDGSGPRGLTGRAIPVESRILALASQVASGEPLGSESQRRFDPVVLQLMNRMSQQEETEESEPGLLDVVRTLVEAGEYIEARNALQLIVNEEAAPPRGVEATLELARLAVLSEQGEEAVSLACRAAETAAHFGPLLAADTGYRSGVVLTSLDATSQAVSLLKETVNLYGDLGLTAQSERSLLALKWVARTALEESDYAKIQLLLEPQHRAVLMECLDWLVEILLRSRSESAKPYLKELYAQFPQAVASVVSRVDDDSQTFAVEVYGGASPSAAGDPVEEAPPSPQMALQTLGQFQLHCGDSTTPVTNWRTSKVKYLLARLASSPGTVTEVSLLEEFWPGDLERARKNLQATVSYLRQSLRKAGLEGDVVQRVPGGFCLNAEFPFWCDLRELRQAHRQAGSCAETGDRVGALKHYRRLFQTYKGPFLEECYMEWALQVRSEVEDLVLEASLELAREAIKQGRFHEALECSRVASKLDPCLEEAVSFAMSAYLGLGRPAAAVRLFEAHKRALSLEFDAFPSIDLERLNQQAKLSL